MAFSAARGLTGPVIGPVTGPLVLGATHTQTQGVGGSLLSLFANGEDGFLFGPFDTFERLFLLSTGSTGNISANDDPVGLNLDRHSWNGASLTAILAAATELLVPGSWTMSVAGGTSTATESPAGTLTLFCDGTNAARADQPLTTVVGRTYRIAATVGTGSVTLRVGTAQGGTQLLADTTVSVGTNTFISFVATSTTSWIRFYRGGSGTTAISAVSCKLVPGRHAVQATTTKRPLWKSNSGKPNLTFDGADDYVSTPYIPGAAGTAVVAFKTGAPGTYAMSGGTGTGNKRVRMGLGTGGIADFAFNTLSSNFDAIDHRNANVVMIQTWGGGIHRCYVDGTLLVDEAVAANMDGTGAGFALGAIDAGTSNFLNGSISFALTRSVLSTPAEIALIQSVARSTFQ